MTLAFLHLRFDRPELLWLLVLALPMVWLGMRRLGTVPPVRRWTAMGLRLAVLILIVLMLAGLQMVRRHTDLTVVAMVDQSQSVRQFVKPPDNQADKTTHVEKSSLTHHPSSVIRWIDGWIHQAAGDKRPGDRFGFLTFDGQPTVRQLPGLTVDTDQPAIDQPTPGTNIAAAIRTGMAMFPPDSGERLVLISDGNDTASQSGAAGGAHSPRVAGGTRSADAEGISGSSAVLEAAREAAAAGVPIDVLPLHYDLKHEAMVQGVYVTHQARRGQTVAVRVVLLATEPTTGTLQLLHNGQPLDLSAEPDSTGTPVTTADWTQRTVTSDRGDTSAGGAQATQAGRTLKRAQPGSPSSATWIAVKSINVPLPDAGVNTFQAVFEPGKGQDAMAANNTAKSFTLVRGKGSILFVNNVPGNHGDVLPHVLELHGRNLRVISPAAFPASLQQLQRYDAVVLQNVPAGAMSLAQQKMLAKYVNNLGGGLLMIGGPKSFGAGGWTNSPVDRILPVNCHIPSQTVLPSGALVLVLDRSGSMGAPVAHSNKTQQELADEAAALALNTLYPQDLVGVVAFDSSATSIVPVQLNTDPANVAKLIRSIHPGGGTNIYSGLLTAYQQLAPLTVRDAAIKHIVLLTDGNSTSGNYTELIGKMRQANITLSTVGVGDSIDSRLLQKLASLGGGHFYEIHDPKHLPQVFMKEARTIRKNLIKETPFVPVVRATGSPIMRGITSVPMLKGLVLTGRKDDPRIFLPLVTPEGAPVFAHWQVGLGRTAAFTSDADSRWAAAWMQWGGFADFWSRVIRRIARPAQSRSANLVTTLQGGLLHVRLEATASSEPRSVSERNTADITAFANFLTIHGTILNPDGSTQPITLQQTGPGIYQGAVPATAPGNYIVSLIAQQPDGARSSIFGGASRTPGAELRQFTSNDALMKDIAQVTGGRVLSPTDPDQAGLFARSKPFVSRSLRPIWPALMLWLLALFLVDVACRRIAWDWQMVRSGAQWVTAPLRFAAKRGERAEATLTTLKRGRENRATRKFEVPQNAVAQENFAQAVGGAVTEQSLEELDSAPVEEEKIDGDGPTTNRLLDAKRKLRKKYEGNGGTKGPRDQGTEM